MPFAPHYRCTALGALGSSQKERFSYSLNLAPGSEAAPVLAPNHAVWADMAEDIRAFHADGASKISARAVLQEVKFAHIGADGKYTQDPTIINVADTPGGVLESNPLTPGVAPQAALAVSLMTARRGPRGKGRFYIPMPVVPLASNELNMSAADRDLIAGSARNLIVNLGNQPGFDQLDLRVVVASTFGHNSEVTGVRVGRVVDTIRSRRRGIPEEYSAILPTVQS